MAVNSSKGSFVAGKRNYYARRRSYSSKLFTLATKEEREARAGVFIALFAVASIICVPVFLIFLFGSLWSKGDSFWAFALLAGVASIAIVAISALKKSFERKEAKEEALERKISAVSVSDDRNDYIIEAADYKRGNPKENFFRKAFQLRLLHEFGNACAKCNRSDNGIDIDHFFLSKNEGGSFILRHREGHLINNALPLCQTCNRSKSDQHYSKFFLKSELPRIFEIR